MNLTPMRFKDYVWPHNPRIYEISYKRDIVCHRVPFGLYFLQNTGRQMRIMRGEGEFAGKGAYAQFKKLATVFYGSTPGTLVHPLWDTTTAYFAALELLQEPTEDYVKYAFEFWECCQSYEQGLKTGGDISIEQQEYEEIYHTVAPGETVWSIAHDLGISVEELMAMNREIRNPVDLEPGVCVKIHE